MQDTDRERAAEPEALTRLFLARANAGDVEGLVALYAPEAVLAVGEVVARGHEEIRRFYEGLLRKRSHFPPVETLPVIRTGPVALTMARSGRGSLSVEVARQGEDGAWLWVIDQLKVEAGPRQE
ncbi:conserved hypothetical protein [Methylobacterium sp. 4-46]|uniref:YybH family protein n=1 Tax=unclassified Methylobacterium TaxID=2615210 RepID=UPI000152E066|nr:MULTISPECIES: nuclear transport factor 2 family protein [Methylobacterium]ACA18155.1 conserved hypothetical protein [Methylobacterium sp. 4-46]WFT77452.1 nuclear transport factor 2 family protein [Methylobacterium nodulans]